jgi:hypothetical protein
MNQSAPRKETKNDSRTTHPTSDTLVERHRTMCKDDPAVALIKRHPVPDENPPEGWMLVTVFAALDKNDDATMEFIGEAYMETKFVKWLHGCEEDDNGCDKHNSK